MLCSLKRVKFCSGREFTGSLACSVRAWFGILLAQDLKQFLCRG